MFRILTVFFMLIFSFSYGITLDELIKEAKKNNPVLKSKRVDIKIKDYEKSEAKSRKFGQINLFANFKRYEDKRLLYPISPPINIRSLAVARNQLVVGAVYRVPIFTGFEIRSKIDISKISEKLKQVEYDLTKNQIIYNIKSVYYQILSLKKQREALIAYKKSLEKLYENIKTAVELGKKPETDLYKVQYRLEEANASIIKVENSINTLKSTLISLVGRDIDLSNVEDVKPEYSSTVFNFKKDINSLETVKKLNLSEKIADKKIRIAKGKYLPSVFLDLSVQRPMGNGYYKDLWYLGFTVNYDLFDFGYRKYNYLKSKLERKKIKYLKRNTVLKINSKIQEAVNNIKTADANLKASKKQLEYAKAVEEAEKAKYQEGTTDLYDYLYAKAQKFLAESKYYQSFYERERAVAYLKYILEEYKDE